MATPRKKKEEHEKQGNGRPTKYLPEYDEQARKLCLLGATDRALADFFGVAESSINEWKLKHPSFSESLKAGKQLADAQVAEKLFNRAMGYSHPETKVFNNQGEVLTHEVVKHCPPDSTAAIFWLKNRQPERWRDRVEQKVVMSEDFDELMGSDDEG